MTFSNERSRGYVAIEPLAANEATDTAMIY